MRKFIQIIAVLALLSLSIPLLADTVHMKNGRTLRGKIVRQSEKEIEIQVGHTSSITVARHQVESIEINEDYGALNEPPTSGETEALEKEESLENSGVDIDTISGFLLGLSIGLIIFSVIIVIPVLSVCLWLAIRIVDSRNNRNRFFTAVGFMIVLTVASILAKWFLPPLAGFVLDVLLLMVVLLSYYKLSFFRALAALLLTIVFEIFGVVFIILILFAMLA